MGENNFINSLKFNEDFAPLRKDDEIKFWGETEMKNLIEFYLKNKPENKDISDKEIKENAGRFKINCILGNNWGGKSRLFEGILKNKIEIKNWKNDLSLLAISSNEFKTIKELDTCIDKKNINNLIILDDFFILSNIKSYSTNDYLLWGKWHWNDFIYYFFNFFVKNNNLRLLSSFLWNNIKNFWILSWYNTVINVDELLKNRNNKVANNQKKVNKDRYIINYKILNLLSKKSFFNDINYLNSKNTWLYKFIDYKDIKELSIFFNFLCWFFISKNKEKFPNVFNENWIFIKIFKKDRKKIFWKLIIILFLDLFKWIGKKDENKIEYILSIEKDFLELYEKIILQKKI